MIVDSLLIIFSYLLGSLSSAIVVCKAFNLPDPREQGSQNPGTTNVLRIGGKIPALTTLVGDVLKGVIPVLLVLYLNSAPIVISIVMVMAFLGHVVPVFFKFQGGKGVATTAGALCALSWQLGLMIIGIWLFIVMITRISSLGAIIAAIAAPFVTWWWLDSIIYSAGVGFIGAVLLVRHHANIRRLLNGMEPKIGKPKQ